MLYHPVYGPNDDTQARSGGKARDDSGFMRFQTAKAEAVRTFERDYLQRALKHANGNVTRAAQLAGKERRAFGKLLKKHGIVRETPVPAENPPV